MAYDKAKTKLLCDTLAWAARRADIPAVKDVVLDVDNFRFTDAFTNEEFVVRVEKRK